MRKPLLDAADIQQEDVEIWHAFNQNVVNKPQHWCGRTRALVSHWWQVTTDAAFLKSGISRRRFWKVLLPAVPLFFFLMDGLSAILWKQPALWAVFDALLFMGACLYASSMSSANLWADAVLSLVLSCLGAAFFFSPPANDTDACSVLYTLEFPITIVIMFCVGFHSLACVWFSAVGALCCLFAPQLSSQASTLIITTSTILVIGFATLEYLVALLYHGWCTQLECNRRLLDAATDGFGIADGCSGEILSASPKLFATFGNSQLVGCRFESIVIAEDRATLTTRFLQGGGTASACETVMVTCQVQQHWQQDLRLVPYYLEGSRLGFCVQKIGEARQHHSLTGEAGTIVAEAAAAVSEIHRLQQQQQQQEEEEAPALEPSGLATTNETGGHAVLAASPNDPGKPPQAPMSHHDDIVVAVAAATSQPQLVQKHLGTLSLSNWTVSADGDHADLGGGMPPLHPEVPAPESAVARKKVETRTLSVQTEPDSPHLPPAPLSASSVEQPEIERAFRKKRLAKAWRSVVEEGEPRIATFAPTPLSTRGNALTQLARGSNVRGRGCCSFHVAWMGLHRIISEELIRRCGSMKFFSDWQCPECRALNDFDADADEEERELEQCCAVCGELVQPVLPRPGDLESSPEGNNDVYSRSGCDGVSEDTSCTSESDA